MSGSQGGSREGVRDVKVEGGMDQMREWLVRHINRVEREWARVTELMRALNEESKRLEELWAMANAMKEAKIARIVGK